MIYYIQTILDFTILVEYFKQNNEKLCYIEHTLSRLNKTKIMFKIYFLIVTKLF